MKLTVDRQILLIALLCWAFGIKCHAQGAVTSNPLEYAAIQQGEARINGQVKSQTDGMENLAGVQGTMVKEANIMKKWEKQYNAYLTTAQGYAEKIALASTLFQDGMQTLTHLWELDLARRINPEGTFATMSMNNLYMEAAAELAKTYRILNQEEVDHYKELKAHMSTKMIGESLEVHCSTEFNRVRSMMYPCAYFEKDNDASGGSKGDFIFRDTADGVEYISIMFEMKNEMETTATKHKNEDFFAKLDKDRKEKGCEYAVLVSLLEPDSELYNEGIVDVSYKYPKMYVIRPQFFMPLISLLTQASKKSIEYQKELILARQQSVDVTNFENKVNAFRDKFAGHYQKASEKFNKAIEEIDKTIKSLQKMKDNLLSSENYLRLANNDTEDLSIKKLTRGNPTMKEKFEEARRMDETSTHLG